MNGAERPISEGFECSLRAASLGVRMMSVLRGGRVLSAVLTAVLTLGLLLTTASSAFAHARFDYADPPVDTALDGTPFVLTAYFTQELTSKSTIRVLDANGTQVDLGDGRVNMDDPDRKMMQVSLPALPVGLYTVETVAESAEDGHSEPGTFMFGVGMVPPAAPTTEEPVPAAPARSTDEAVPALEPAAPAAEETNTWWPWSWLSGL